MRKESILPSFMDLSRFLPLGCLLFVFCSGLFLEAQTVDVDKYTPTVTVEIPMRDGTLLPTDIYYPTDKTQHYPCLLLRNPGGRKAYPWRSYASLTAAGYVVAMQDTRSALDVEGKTLPFYSDGWGEHRDGYDTVEWLAKSEFSNGKIGTLGFSACGITQLLLAPSAPPSLCCQYIGVAASSLYHQGVYPGGRLLQNQVEGWLACYARHPSVQILVAQQPFYNAFWKEFDSTVVANQVKVPGLHYGGWYDTFIQGTLDAFTTRQEQGAEGARGKQKLVVGPWTHSWPRDTRLGDFTVPKNGTTTPWDISPLVWFDYYLKGKPTPAASAPVVTYYTMGPFDGTSSDGGNRWQTATQWPVPAKATAWYLMPQGELSSTVVAKEGVTRYSFNPRLYIPTLGGRNLFLESGPKDQRSIEGRTDIVLFTSSPLAEEIEVTGRIIAKIYYASSAPCDIVIRLTDVYPDGRSILIADGLLCAEAAISQEGNVKLAEVDLWSTSMVFAKGHSIRISVSNSNYPRYQPITSDSSSIEVTLLQGPKTPSQIILPIVAKK